MRTPRAIGNSRSIVLQPHAGQFVINELPTLVLCCAMWGYGGMEDLPLTAVAVPFAVLLTLLLFYRYYTCGAYATASAQNNLSASTGLSAAKRTTWSCTASWIFRNIKVFCNSSAG